MGDLLNYLKSQNVDPKSILVPANNQPSFPAYNRTGIAGEFKDIDYEADANYFPVLGIQEELRADKQSSLSKLGNTVGQGVGTFLTATASTIAAIPSIGAGLLAEGADIFMEGDQVSGMDIALNNPIMKGIGDLDKYIKEEIVPTYYSKDQQDRIFSASTGTDLINGVGFLLSNIIPASLATKGLGFLPKFAAAAKAGKLESSLQTAIGKGLLKAEDATQLNVLGKFFEKAPAMTGALVGRLGESAMEANGVYESVLANGGTEEQAQRGRDNAFYGNMALSVSDLAQQTRWLKPTGLGDDIIKKGLGYAVKKRTKSELIGDFMKESLQEAGEEGFQFLVQKGSEKSSLEGTNFLTEALNAGGDLFGTVEGQKSMLLGAVLGGGASSIANKINAPKKAIKLQEMVNELNSNAGVVTDKYIETPDGKRIINPAFAKQSQTFLKLDELRAEALEQGDIETAQLIEKQQFTNLVQSRVENDKFDDLIDELEALGKVDNSELIQYFGEVPTDVDGNKLTASQVSIAKIQEAKQVKKMIDNLNTIPQYRGLSTTAKNDFNNHILTQDNLLKSIQQLDGKIAALEATKSFIIPETVGVTTEIQEILDPVAAEQIKELKTTREELAVKYDEVNKFVKEALKEPAKLEVKIAKKEEEELNRLTNEIEAEDNILTETEIKLTELKNNPIDTAITITTPNGDMLVNVVNGKFIDPTTGEEIDEELVKQSIKAEVVETKKAQESGEGFTEKDEYQETEDVVDRAKKPDLFSTSTRGFEVDAAGNKVVTFYGNRSNEAAYQKDSKFYNIVTWFSNWRNTPGLNNKKYTARVFIEQPTEKTLTDVNNWRRSKKLEDLTMEDLMSNPGYMLIGINILENGKSVSEDILHYHDVDYFANTQEFENLAKESVNEEELAVRLQESREKFIKERTKLIDAIKANNQVEIEVVSKSNGIVNYNPKIGGKNQVLPIFHLGDLGGKIRQKDKDGKPIVYSNGIGVIVAEDEETYTIRYEGNKEGKQGYESIIFKTEFNGYIGQTVFGTVTANGSPYLTKTTQREFSDENIESLATLINHRLTTQENTFKVGNQEFTIIGKDGNRGIVDSLINWGFKKDAKEKQIQFKADGTLVLGKQEVLPTDPEAKQKIIKFLAVQKSYPSFTIGTLDSKLAFPTEIVDGQANTDIQTVAKFLFAGDAPLIGTNINSEVPFINSYFQFKVGPNGLNIVTSEETEVDGSYMDDLGAASGTRPEASEVSKAETIGELTDEGEIKPVTNQKADAQTVKNRMQEIEKQPAFINITQDASGKMEQTSEEVISQIKSELDKIGLPYTDVIANDKGSTYFVVTKDGQQHEILKLLKTGGALVKPTLTKAKWINHLIKTQPQDLYDFVNAELNALEQPANVKTNIETFRELKSEIERLRKLEQAEYDAMADPNDAAEKEKIYNRYDKLITPLLQKAKADIKTRRQNSINKIKSLVNETSKVFSPKGTINEKLLELGKFFQDKLGWKFEGNRKNALYVSKENNRAEFDIDGIEVNMPEGLSFRAMGGGHYPSFSAEELIKAKYDAELAALETKPIEVKPVTTELDKEVEENDKVCQGNNPKDSGKPATLGNKKFKDSDDSDWN